MSEFEVAVALVGVAVGVAVFARWLRLPYPILLVVGGLVLSLQPGVPAYTLHPDVVLMAFLPPLLYAAAFRTHWPTFRKHLRAITLLAVGLVLFTTTAVAWAAHEWLNMAWGPAFVLGAVVSPPDAVAAMAVTQRVRLPRATAAVIEGESLVNDAAALVAYRLAVAAVVAGGFDAVHAAGQFALVSAGGIAVGLVGGVVACRVHTWLNRTGLGDAKITIALTLLTPFAVYLPAEHLGVSGVLAAVVCGLWVGTRADRVFPDEQLTEARAVWETVEFLLNSLIFIMIGFQLPVVLGTLGDSSPRDLLVAVLVVSGVVIGSRLVWMFPGAYLPRLFDEKVLRRHVDYPPWQLVTVVAWTGMRGVVSLAAAMAVPKLTATGEPFPDRDRIVFLTFWVIFATLVGQGVTLPLLIRALGVHRRPDPDELRKSRLDVPILRKH